VGKSDREAESMFDNLVKTTSLENRKRLIRMGLHLIETGTIKLGGEMMELYKAELTQEEEDDLTKRFTYHPPKPGQNDIYAETRNIAWNLAAHIITIQPNSRERSLAITKLEECIMWANAGIARNT
jgi:hypothetical protein